MPQDRRRLPPFGAVRDGTRAVTGTASAEPSAAISRPPSGLSGVLDNQHDVKLGLPVVKIGRHDPKNKTSGDFFKRKDKGTFH